MSEPSNGSPRRALTASNSWPGLAAAILTVATVGVTLSGIAPLLSLNLEHQGVDPAWNGLMGAIPSLAMISVSPFIPQIVRCLGAAQAIYASSMLAFAITLLFPFVDYLPAWFVMRFFMALGMGVALVISETWVNALAPAEKRGTVMGIYTSVFCIGLATGTLLISFVGSEGTTPFAVCAAFLPSPDPTAIANRSGAPDFRHHPPMPLRQAFAQAPLVMFATLICGAVWISILALLPVYGVRSGMIQGQALFLLTAYVVGNIGFQIPFGRLLDRWSAPLILAACGIFQLLGAVTLPLVVREGALAWPVLAMWGATLGAVYTTALTMLGRTFTTEQLTGASSAQSLAFEIGAVSGPLLAGIGMRAWNPDGMLIVIGAAGMVLAYYGIRTYIAERSSSAR
jgi:MFS family permease